MRPKLNVFGHIHEAWGAAVVRWPRSGSGMGIGAGEGAGAGKGQVGRGKGKGEKEKGVEMTVLMDRRDVEVGWLRESKEERRRKEERVERILRDGYCHLEYPEKKGGSEQTLFVNAAVPNAPGLAPWLVDVELPRSVGDAKGGSTPAEEGKIGK